MSERGLEALLVNQPENRLYLSGFTGSAGWLLVTQSTNMLAVDFRYVGQAHQEAPDWETVRIENEIFCAIARILVGLSVSNVGIESDYLPVSSYYKLLSELKNLESPMQLTQIESLTESLRAVKDSDEILSICEAVELSDMAYNHAFEIIRPGISEIILAWEIEKYMREQGGEDVPFDIIVASGPNSALPHAKPTSRPILENEPVVIDIGARKNHYTSDLTRTLILGKGNQKYNEIYELVLSAQLTTISMIQTGIKGSVADALGREVIRESGYENNFGHGMGHGVGLATHELPRLTPMSNETIEENMVFTIEPGVYIQGWGGIRIEDMVFMEKGKPKLLGKSPKRLQDSLRR